MQVELETIEALELVPCSHGGDHTVDFLRALAERRKLGYDIENSHFFCGRCRFKIGFMEALTA